MISKQSRRAFLSTIGIGLTTGCLRLVTGGQTTTEVPTTGAAKTSTATPTGGNVSGSDFDLSNTDLPIGLRADGAYVSLVETHLNALQKVPFSIEVAHNERTQPEVMSASVDGDYATVRMWAPSFSKEVFAYRTPSTIYNRALYKGEEILATTDELEYWESDLHASRPLKNHIEAVHYAPVEFQDRAGETLIKLEPQRILEPRMLTRYHGGDSVQIEEYSGVILVNETGIIRKAEFTVRYSHKEEPERLRITIDELGSAKVIKPDWVADVATRMPRFSAKMSSDQTYILLTHESGDPLEAPTSFSGYQDGSGMNEHAYLKEGISSGETLYLSLKEKPGLQIQTSPPTDVGRQFTDRFELGIWCGVKITTLDIRA